MIRKTLVNILRIKTESLVDCAVRWRVVVQRVKRVEEEPPPIQIFIYREHLIALHARILRFQRWAGDDNFVTV